MSPAPQAGGRRPPGERRGGWPAEEHLGRLLQVAAGEFHKLEHPRDRERRRHVPLRVDRVDDDERLLKTLCPVILDIDNLPRLPAGGGLEKRVEPAVVNCQELAEVPGEPLGHVVRPVNTACLRKLLQEEDIIYVTVDVSLDVQGVKRCPVHGALDLSGTDGVGRDRYRAS